MSEGNNWKRVNEARALHESFMPKNKYGMLVPKSQRWGDMAFEEDYPRILAEQEARRAAEAAAAEAARIAAAEREAARQAAVEALIATPGLSPEIAAQIRELVRLDRAAQAAPLDYTNVAPQEGNFKRDATGKLFRYTTRFWKKMEPTASNYNAGKAAAAPESVANPSVGDYKKIKGKVFRWTEEPAWLQVDRKTNYNIDLADTFARHNTMGKPYLNARDRLWSILYPDQPVIHRPARFRGRRNTRRTNRRSNRRKATRKY